MAQIYTKSLILGVHNLLLVAATPFAIQPLLSHLGLQFNPPEPELSTQIGNWNCTLLITGVGMVNTAYAMGTMAQRSFDLCLNAGVCGAFNRSLALGEVVLVQSDTLSELGAEDGENFIPFEKMGLGGKTVFVGGGNRLGLESLKQVSGITVNTVHGNERSIRETEMRTKAHVESMEGAAFLMACETRQWPAYQIRAVSNYVESRNKAAWEMPLAIEHLNQFLIHLLNQLTAQP